jgi:hypothetical protein
LFLPVRFFIDSAWDFPQNPAMSQNNQALRAAFLKGYRVANGNVVTPEGKPRAATLYDGYLSFNFGINAKQIPVKVHRLVAYQKYGEEALVAGRHVRHLDGNPVNNLADNIAIGSAHDNSMDRPKQNRVSHAAKGRQKFSPEFIQSLREEYLSGIGYRQLSAKHGLPPSTLSYYLSKSAKKTSVTFAA